MGSIQMSIPTATPRAAAGVPNASCKLNKEWWGGGRGVWICFDLFFTVTAAEGLCYPPEPSNSTQEESRE